MSRPTVEEFNSALTIVRNLGFSLGVRQKEGVIARALHLPDDPQGYRDVMTSEQESCDVLRALFRRALGETE